MINETFIDYYEDLQVSQNADAETISRVYRLLARKWHPDNALTGNPEKFNVINAAYSVLSHPEKRAAYDAGYENRRNSQLGMLSADFQPSRGGDQDNDIRYGILSVLYAARRQDAEKPDIGMWRLEQLLGWPEKEIGFHIWFLKEKAWIYRSDTGGYAITVTGAEVIEARKSGSSNGRLITENRQHDDEPPAGV
jgi:curved DNA-binding protein